MSTSFIRSTIYNLCYYTLTAFSCVALLPTLLLPRGVFLMVVRGYVYTNAFLEKYILGLTYEVRGKENLPKDGSYIIAAKHQSAYETLKLHILFKDPAIVLKKELLKIPLWGWYLAKSDVIAIDRSSPKAAIKSIKAGAQHIAAQGRPIIIFPQGTRVNPETTTKEKPYKIGIVRMQDAANVPIIPLALNTGMFQPKNAWLKKSGRVIFEFMPAIAPSDNPSETLKQIETMVEKKSKTLMDEARNSTPKKRSIIKTAIISAAIILTIYTINWFAAAHITKNSVMAFMDNLAQRPAITAINTDEPEISGFPFKISLALSQQTIKTLRGEELSISDITAKSWPFMGMAIDIETGSISISRPHWKQPLNFNSLNAQIISKNNLLKINHSSLKSDQTQGQVSGTIKFSSAQYPEINLNLNIINYAPLLAELITNNIVKEQAAMFANVALQAMQKDNIVSTTITSNKNKIYLGMLKIIELPPIDMARANPASDQ